MADQLSAGLAVGSWTVGLAVMGLSGGLALNYIFNKIMPISQGSFPDKVPGLRSLIQIGVGTVALGNMMGFILPPDAISPVGDGALYFFFFGAQVLDILGSSLPSLYPQLPMDVRILINTLYYRFVARSGGSDSPDSEDPKELTGGQQAPQKQVKQANRQVIF